MPEAAAELIKQEEKTEISIRPKIEYLKEIVAHAEANVPFYNKIYKNVNTDIQSLDDFAQLPRVTNTIYGREHISTVVTNVEDMFETRGPIRAYFPETKTIRIVSIEEARTEYDVIYDTLELENRDLSKEKIMVAGDVHSLIGLNEMIFCFSGFDTPLLTMSIADHSDQEIRKIMNRFQPTMFFNATNRAFPNEVYPGSVNDVYHFNRQELLKEAPSGIMYHDLYTHPLFGLVAMRNADEDCHLYCSWFFHIEENENQQLILTSTYDETQPKIRFQTADRGTVTGKNQQLRNTHLP